MALRFYVRKLNILCAYSTNKPAVLSRWISSYAPPKNPEEKIVISDDGTTIICWHPEVPFPYECTRPLPEQPAECNSVLNVQHDADIRELYKPKSAERTREELMKLTHTTKHRWFPRSRDKYAKKTPPDREYL